MCTAAVDVTVIAVFDIVAVEYLKNVIVEICCEDRRIVEKNDRFEVLGKSRSDRSFKPLHFPFNTFSS